MIQIFWIIDFIGLFLGRLILGIFLFIDFWIRRKLSLKQKILGFIYLILSIFIILGYFSSFAFIFLIILEVLFILRSFILRKESLKDLEFRFLRLALGIVFLFVGPGSLSLDRIFNIRF